MRKGRAKETMTILNELFFLTFIAINSLVSHGFLPHEQKSPLHSQFWGRTRHPYSAGLSIDQRFKPRNGSEQNVLIQHRRSVANVQTMGLFGLGAAEIVIVLAAVAFIIGPQQLGSMAGQIKGDLPDDLKKIPEEFQKGFEESTENSRARNAKQMEAPSDEDVEDK